MVVDTKLQAHVTPEMFGDGYKIALEAMKGVPPAIPYIFCFQGLSTDVNLQQGEPLYPLDPKTLDQGTSTTLYGALSPDVKGK